MTHLDLSKGVENWECPARCVVEASVASRNGATGRTLYSDRFSVGINVPDGNVLDESRQHEGHAGHRPGGQTHYCVYIVSEAFKGKTRLERHRMINQVLAGELSGGIHALAIHAAAPEESEV